MASITGAAAVPPREIQGRSLWQDARRRLFANKAAVTSMIILSIVAFLSVVMPFVWPHQFDQVYIDRISCPPPDYLGMTAIFGSQAEICPSAVGQGHIFGTDANGRDLFIRVMHGGRVSLSIGVTATFVALLIGVLYGAPDVKQALHRALWDGVLLEPEEPRPRVPGIARVPHCGRAGVKLGAVG